MFSTLLSARLERHPWWTDRAVAFASALHLALLATLLSISSLLLDEVKPLDPPSPRQEFENVLQLVLPGPPPAAPAPELQQESKPPAPSQRVQPVRVPAATEVAENVAPPENSAENVADSETPGPTEGVGEAGIDGGIGKGGSGGLGTNESVGGNSDDGAPVDAERDSNIVKPEAIDRAEPAYPRVAQLARVTGVVKLTAVVGLDGRVESVTVKSGNPMLVEAARTAVLRWRYTPALRDGQPIRVFISVRVTFALR